LPGTLEETVLPSLLNGRHSRTRHTDRLRPAILALGTALLVGCSSAAVGGGSQTAVTLVDPEARAVRIDTTGCELTSGHFGSGVTIGGNQVVTVAHLIARAETVTVSVAGGGPEVAEVVALDLQKDLAVLRIAGMEAPEVDVATADTGTSGHIVGAAASGTVPFEVKRRVNLRIEDVLGTERHSRLGYEVSAVTTDGDSGAGAYDDDGGLVGIVFATGRDGATSWLTASDEIEAFRSSLEPNSSFAVCQ
jgi:S1-C subfamily serine protease